MLRRLVLRHMALPLSLGFQQGDVDVLEYLTGRDTENTVGGLDQIVALASRVQTAERVGEAEAGAELLGVDQKARAIGDPWTCGFHACLEAVLSSRLSVLSF